MAPIKCFDGSNASVMRFDMQVLVIDEISMVSGEMFEHLETIVSDVRGNHEEAFGGLQVILCGDYFQYALPD